MKGMVTLIKQAYGDRPGQAAAKTKLPEAVMLTELAHTLRDELGDSLSEGTSTRELERAILTILREAGCADA